MPSFGLQRLYIGGAYVDATSGTTFDTFDPATGEKLATVQQASAADIDRAVQSAQEGQREWAALTAMQRSRILRRAVELLRNEKFDAKNFHDFILAQGLLPPDLMRKAVMEDFVPAQKGSAASGAAN